MIPVLPPISGVGVFHEALAAIPYKHFNQEKILTDHYKLVFPEWDRISKIQVVTGIWLKCPEVTSRV